MPDSSTPEIGPEIVEQMRRTLKPVVRVDELRQHFTAHRREWGFPSAMRFSSFLGSLLRNGGYTEVQLHSSVYAPMKRYAYSEPNPYVLGCTLREGAYLTHGSALALHSLSSPSTTIYVNREQSAKPRPDGDLTQEGITRAFANSPRTSQYILEWNTHSFVLLSGKNTGRLNVIRKVLADSGTVDLTDLERTLIDAAVRPNYCGGVESVARAYATAKGRLDASRLLTVLSKLDHVYPYHQAVGFYMDRAGYPATELDKLRALGLRFDFYLTYKLLKPKYSPQWKIYYPRDL